MMQLPNTDEDDIWITANLVQLDDDNEPAPENIPQHNNQDNNIMADTWGHNGTCARKLTGARDVQVTINYYPAGVMPNLVQLFELFFMKAFVKDVILQKLNKNIDTGMEEVQYGEFLRWIGLWFQMATIQGPQRQEYWASEKVVLDSSFCVVKGITELLRNGVFAAVLIKKRCYWPCYVLGDEICQHFDDKNVGKANAWSGKLDGQTFQIHCLKEPDYVMSLMTTYGSLSLELVAVRPLVVWLTTAKSTSTIPRLLTTTSSTDMLWMTTTASNTRQLAWKLLGPLIDGKTGCLPSFW